jgi:hypothetical protein
MSFLFRFQNNDNLVSIRMREKAHPIGLLFTNNRLLVECRSWFIEFFAVRLDSYCFMQSLFLRATSHLQLQYDPRGAFVDRHCSAIRKYHLSPCLHHLLAHPQFNVHDDKLANYLPVLHTNRSIASRQSDMCRTIQSGQCQSHQQCRYLLHDNDQFLWIDQLSGRTFLNYYFSHRENKSTLTSCESDKHVFAHEKKQQSPEREKVRFVPKFVIYQVFLHLLLSQKEGDSGVYFLTPLLIFFVSQKEM